MSSFVYKVEWLCYIIPNPNSTRVRQISKDKPTYYVVSMTETAIKPPSFKRPDRYQNGIKSWRPTSTVTPKEAVRFKSMTLKEAYSVPKHTSAICVQSFDDSLNSAIHITYRISLRSSSLREPRYPLLRVLDCFDISEETVSDKS